MKPIVHPNWLNKPQSALDGYSLEVTAKDIPALEEVAHSIWSGAPIAIPFLPGEAQEARITAVCAVRALGFVPMPHFSARRIDTLADFTSYLHSVVKRAGVERCFVVAGDPSTPSGPFPDSASLLATGAFEQAGIKVIGVGGHPEGHPVMSSSQCMAALKDKCGDIEHRGMAPLIVTQFGFDADAMLSWLESVRQAGLEHPVRLGVPGPAGIKTLLRFAAMCGVSASASVLAKYGLSISALIGSAGPDKFVDKLAAGLGPQHGMVRLHFYPFGDIRKTVKWVADYQARTS